MQMGDLVKRKFVTRASMRRAKSMNVNMDEIGIVIELAENACKVLFTQKNQVRSFLQNSLEVISESERG